jgi:hypothetical protein
MIAVVVLSGMTTDGAAMDLPSGNDAVLHEILVEQIGNETWTRFRVVAPQIDRTLPQAPTFAELEPDFPHLCATLALPYLESHGIEADKIVISIADRIVEFGVSDPDATQYFEQFRLKDGSCVWEGF